MIDAESYADALRQIGEHFLAWAADTPSDDPDTWDVDASLSAPHFTSGSVVHLIPESD